MLNGSAPLQQSITMPINPTAILPIPVLPAQVVTMASEPIGTPSECLLLKNMFDPATEVSISMLAGACDAMALFFFLICAYIR